MKTFLANYKQTLILLASIIIGAIAGIVFGEKVTVLAPFGDLFLNLLLVIIVPLIFLTITTSIAKISQPKRLGKILGTTVLVFIIMSLVAVLVGMLVTYPIKLVNIEDSAKIHTALDTTLEATTETDEDMTLLSRFLSALTVNDFSKLLSRDNLLAIIVFAILFGIAIKRSGEKGKLALDTLESFMNVIMSLLNIVMYYAPIGLGCYFAVLTGTFGASIAIGYAKTFIVYTLVAFAFYFIMYTIYAFIAAGKKGVKAFWKNILPATITSLATCSSAASIPVNLDATKKMGVPEDIAETVIPLGANVHKDGSVVTGVLKIAFLLGLLGTNMNTIPMMLAILGVAFINGAVMGAIPGGGFMSEMLIVSAFGIDPALLPIIVVIGTILDAPATLLNSTENTVCAMLVARLVEGKDWLKNKINN